MIWMRAMEPESLDEQYLMEDAGFGGQDITYEIGSASGPCITHNDIWHPKCQNHECCIGHHATTCRAVGYDPPEYQHPEDEWYDHPNASLRAIDDEYDLRPFDEYERITDENLDTEQTS